MEGTVHAALAMTRQNLCLRFCLARTLPLASINARTPSLQVHSQTNCSACCVTLARRREGVRASGNDRARTGAKALIQTCRRQCGVHHSFHSTLLLHRNARTGEGSRGAAMAEVAMAGAAARHQRRHRRERGRSGVSEEFAGIRVPVRFETTARNEQQDPDNRLANGRAALQRRGHDTVQRPDEDARCPVHEREIVPGTTRWRLLRANVTQ